MYMYVQVPSCGFLHNRRLKFLPEAIWNRHLQLDCNHEYYYQVQGQLALCESEYSDFICWSPEGLFVEHINADQSFFSKLQTKLDAFFVKVVLPQLLTSNTTLDNEKSQEEIQLSSSHSADTSYCLCHQGESGWIIACDNPNCSIEWFHFECAGLTRKFRRNWFCSDSCWKLCSSAVLFFVTISVW